MTRNGMHLLGFQAAALVRRQLTYLRATQFAGRLVTLCFLPYACIVAVETLDRQADQFQRIDAALLIVGSSAHPFRRMWIEQSEKPWTAVLADPCGQLHRSYVVAIAEPSLHCHTFVINQKASSDYDGAQLCRS